MTRGTDLHRLSNLTDDIDSIEAIASLAINKPARDWSDRDPERANYAIAELSVHFTRAETLAHIKGRHSSQHAIAVVFGTGDTSQTLMQAFTVTETERELVRALSMEIIENFSGRGIAPRILSAALADAGFEVSKEENVEAPSNQVAAS